MAENVRLEGWSGGGKHMWLRLHRAEILDYLWEHNTAATLAHFHMTFPTLENLCTDDPAAKALLQTIKGTIAEDPILDAVLEARRDADAARVIADRARQSNADLRREIRELKQAFGTFQETIADQIASRITQALMYSISAPQSLEIKADDSLSVKKILEGRDGQTDIGKPGLKRLGRGAREGEPGGQRTGGDLLPEPR